MFPNGVITAQGKNHASNSIRANNILAIIQRRYPCYAKWEGDMAGTYNGTLGKILNCLN